eukprot:2698183-Prymnesium_polylepis.1
MAARRARCGTCRSRSLLGALAQFFARGDHHADRGRRRVRGSCSGAVMRHAATCWRVGRGWTFRRGTGRRPTPVDP